jgi:flagellar biosynthesis protein FlgN
MIEKTWPIAEKLILNTLYLTRQLYQHLVQEADILKKSPQAELIDNITANKKQLVIQLEQFNLQCGHILATEGLPNNQDGIKEYFQRTEAAGLPTTETINNWSQIQLICSECRTLNEQNGAGIELLAHHAKRSLNILKGKTRGSNTYGPDGVTQSDSLTHTLTFYL